MNPDGKLTIGHTYYPENKDRLLISGDLDIQTAHQLKVFVDRLIQQGKNNLILDLKDLAYLDSSGYGAIVDASRRTRATSGSLDLANMPNWMAEFFDLSVLEIAEESFI